MSSGIWGAFFGLLTDSGGIGAKSPLPNVTFDRSSGGLKEVTLHWKIYYKYASHGN